MNIEIGVGIGNSSLANLSPSDRLIAYVWASALIPSVTTSSVIHKTMNAIVANSNPSALAPTLSSAENTVITTVSAHANSNVFVPSVAIAGSLSINAMIASSNVNGMIPTVSTIRNVSVSGIAANGTASAGVPNISLGGGATYYLQIDGVDDYVAVPSFSWDEVIMDFSASQTGSYQKYLGISNGAYIQVASRPTDNWDATFFNFVSVNGSQVAINTDFVPYDTRVLLRALRVNSDVFTSAIFRNGLSGGFMKGNLYSVSFLLGGVVKANYDMSTGTVLDQSGNGNDAILTGGTWVAA